MAPPASRTTPIRPGLQPQRTALSWTRVSLAFLSNGVLLLARLGLLAEPSPIHETATVIAFLLALVTALIAHRRRQILSRHPLPKRMAARLPLLGLGIGTMIYGLIVLTVIFTG